MRRVSEGHCSLSFALCNSRCLPTWMWCAALHQEETAQRKQAQQRLHVLQLECEQKETELAMQASAIGVLHCLRMHVLSCAYGVTYAPFCWINLVGLRHLRVTC